MRPGMWSYVVTAGTTVLETGKALIEESKVWATIDRPAKNIKVLKR
jgi:hypothetical protein